MAWLNQHGGKIVLTGFPGKTDVTGSELKNTIRSFFESLRPHAEKAAELGITIAIENQQGYTLHHPDYLRYFGELNPYRSVGVALAFHHLHHWTDQIPSLIQDLGASQIPFIYFQEHSEGARTKVAKEIELQQLPGFGGGLDYRPIVKALRQIQFSGLVSLFMHPTPRGIPILPTVEEVTSAVKRARAYIDSCLEATV
jgi:sugar phosphate isomerase/epimerase